MPTRAPYFAPIVVLGLCAASFVTPAGASVDNSQTIDVNNIRMFVTNTGSIAWDKTTGAAGFEYPKGTGKTCVFAAGLWLAAQVGGTPRVVVSEYSDEYGPGAMVGTAADNPSKPEYKVYKLSRTYATGAARDSSVAAYNAGAVPHGAPAVSVLSDGTVNILGDQMLWAVYNDADPAYHANRAGSTAPLGVEVQQTTFAFNRANALGNTVFVRYKIINKGGNTLDGMYMSLWADPDVGSPIDDLVGCDTTSSLGFAYNGSARDTIYGAMVPSVGFDMFQGPSVGALPGDTLGMTSFNAYTNGTDPIDHTQTFNLMRGFAADGSIRINPATGNPTTYMYSGDPVLGTGWLDPGPPQDVRLQLSSGPFTMMPSDSQIVTVAIVVGQATDRLSSVALMKFRDQQVQAAFDYGAPLAVPLPSAPARLTLAAPRPNPARSTFALDLACARAAMADLEVYDVGGRRILMRDLGMLAAGPHSVTLDLSGRPAGLYLIRLRQGGEIAGTRVLLLR